MILKIYLESKKDKILVGILERKKDEYVFSYNEKYYYSESPLQIGPELSLKKRIHKSKELFSIFNDRIPSRKNAAYEEYCRSVGIDKDEKDEMVLLAKLGARGPSSFVIEEPNEEKFTREDLVNFRKKLDLTMREFSEAFDISLSSVQRIENGRVEGNEVLKRIEIYAKFDEVAKFEVLKNKEKLHSSIFDKILNVLKYRQKI
jgi:HipA-like protein